MRDHTRAKSLFPEQAARRSWPRFGRTILLCRVLILAAAGLGMADPTGRAQADSQVDSVAGDDDLEQTLALLHKAEQEQLNDASLTTAGQMLANADLFVQGAAEWAIATRIGRDNNREAITWPKAESPAWYRAWSTLSQQQRAEMDWVRQAIALGIYNDRTKLLASADDLLRRAQGLEADARSDDKRRKVMDRAVAELTRVRQAMAVTAVDMPRLRSLWLEARRALRPAVFAQAAVDCDQVVFSTVFGPHHAPNVVGTHTSWTHKPGGDLCVLSGLRGREIQVHPILSGKLGPGHVHGLDLWFDADRIVFAWASQVGWPRPRNCKVPPDKSHHHELRLAHEPAHLYEVGVDGDGLRQLTRDPYWTDVEPAWLPDGGVAFTSDRCAHGVVCDSFGNDEANLNLYARLPDGTIRRLTNNKDIDRHPHLLDNGSLAYTRWEYQERHFWDIHSIWTVRPNGTMADVLFKQHLPRPMGLRDARSVSGTEKLVAIATGHHTYAYGPVVVIDPTHGINAADAIRTVTPGSVEQEGRMQVATVPEGGVQDAGGYYQTPCALSSSCFLVSYAYGNGRKYDAGAWGGVDSNGMGLYLIDTLGNKELIYRDPLLGTTYPLPVKKRPRPPLTFDVATRSQPWATCLLSDVYAGMGPGVKRGTVKWLRVSESLPWPLDAQHGSYKWAWGPAWMPNPAHTSWNPVRVIGLVPVEEDGSAHFQVPTVHAGSVYFQVLDADFLEVRRMRSNVSFQPGEVRSCYGCHESQPVTAAASSHAMAAAKPAIRSEPPSWGADRAIGYEWLVQPVLDRHCMSCHNGSDPRTKLDLTANKVMTVERELNRSYLSLMGNNLTGGGAGNGKDSFVWICNRFSDGSVSETYAFGSSRSRLVEILKKGHYDVKLGRDEWLRLVTWIDANCVYHDRLIDKRPDDGGKPRRDAEFRWPAPFATMFDGPWMRAEAAPTRGTEKSGPPAHISR